MKKLVILNLIFAGWFLSNTTNAQNLGFDSLSTNMGSLPDTINLNDNYIHTLVLYNRDATTYTGTIYLVAGLDSSGTLVSVDTVGSVFVSNFGYADTVSITYTETYNTSNSYKVGDNIVVVWPVAGTSTERDTIYKHVYIKNIASIFESNNIEDNILIYPNPTNGKLEVVIKDDVEHTAQIKLIDVNGKTIKQLNIFSNKTILDISDLPKGIYFIEVFNDKLSYYKKIIKY